MFRKAVQKQNFREMQRRRDRELAEAMFRTAKRPAALAAQNALAAHEGDLMVAEAPSKMDDANQEGQFTVDLLGS